MEYLSEAEIHKYDYLYLTHPEYGQVNEDEPRFVMALSFLHSIINAKTVLDAGVGRGGFYNLIRNDFDAHGIEPSKVAVEKFHVLNPKVKNILIQELPLHFNKNTFDVVVCLDVLEHIPLLDLHRTLEALTAVGAKHFIISIATHEDTIDGMALHVNLMSHEEWAQELSKYFSILAQESIHNDRSRVYCLEKKQSAQMASTFFDEQRFLSLKREQEEAALRPLFSILVPTYNQARFLPAALESLIAQTFERWEAVVVNDGSTDETAQVMQEYASKDKRIRIFHKENGGVASALNEGLKHARGEWICWLSSDDLFEPDKLQVHLDAIQAHPECKFFHSHFYYLVEESGTKTEPDLWFPIPDEEYRVSRFFLGNYVHGNAVAIHRDVFTEVGAFDESLRQAQDFDMWLRISAKFQSYFIDKRTCVTRIHKGQTTNSFPEGCYYDSAWACIKFLNKRSFTEMFPQLNLQLESDARKAILEAITLSITHDAFMNRCGFLHAFLDRAHEWLTTDCPRTLRPKLIDFISYILSKNNFSQVSPAVVEIIRKLGRSKRVVFRSVDFLAHLERNIDERIKQGDQQKALLFERYATQLVHRVSPDEFPMLRQRPFTPRLLGPSSAGDRTPLASENVLSWFIEPLTYSGYFRHTLRITCSACDKTFPFVTELFAGEEAQEVRLVCPGCKHWYSFSDGKINRYILDDKEQMSIQKKKGTVREKPKVTFLARGIHGKSGGTIVFAKHIQWLADLGCEVVVYSDTPKPLWVNLPGKFVQVKDFREIDPGDVDLAVLYCIFELPDLLKKVEVSKIVYICQAYEGYLYGRHCSELRSDKPFFTALHSVPINVIAVSHHLSDHFQKKFGRMPYYVPNSVNHSVFKPDPAVRKDSPSILFIGNPYHPREHFLPSAYRHRRSGSINTCGRTYS